MKSVALAKTPMIGVKLATLEQARAMDREAIAIVGEWEANFWKLGEVFVKVVDTGAYKALGFATEGEWLEARLRGSYSLSKAFSAMRCARLLSGIPEEKRLQIGTVNANLLTKLPERLRTLPGWVDKAVSESTQKFRESVGAKLGIEPSKFRTWSRPFDEGVSDLMDGAEAHLAKKYSLDIESNPGLRNVLWASVANFILQNEDIELEVSPNDHSTL